MPGTIREAIEERENESLCANAQQSSQSRGRWQHEEEDGVRTCFQRDRDRILHCKSFRRLNHKTQVFIAPLGDHYRTRLTHSLEVAQIARTIGRALRLNEDLIEAIALGHDVGHTPFGHIGEDALDEVLRSLDRPDSPKSFRHYEHSLRVVDDLERLNLTHEVREGIGGHSKGRSDLTAQDGEQATTLEGAVVRISDRIAYLNHDLDDAIRSGIIDEIPAAFSHIGPSHSRRIGAMVRDAIQSSLDQPIIRLSDEMLAVMNSLKEWLYENVYYEYPRLYPDIDKAKGLVRSLFLHYLEPGHLPEGFSGSQGAIDYVAGMTDRFAIERYRALYIPTAFEERIRTVL